MEDQLIMYLFMYSHIITQSSISFSDFNYALCFNIHQKFNFCF